MVQTVAHLDHFSIHGKCGMATVLAHQVEVCLEACEVPVSASHPPINAERGLAYAAATTTSILKYSLKHSLCSSGSLNA
jgi:hypothetical protein